MSTSADDPLKAPPPNASAYIESQALPIDTWLVENAAGIEAINQFAEANGLPLRAHRKF